MTKGLFDFIDGLHVVVGASVGIARRPQQGKDPQELLRAADRAMYEAKHHGRNRAELAGKP